MATDFLNKRLQLIQQNTGELPKLKDIEKTHILFTLAYYKPFVSIAQSYYIYNKKI